MLISKQEEKIIHKIREIRNTTRTDTIVTIKLVKVGTDYMPVVYRSTPISTLGLSKAMLNLLEDMKKGLENKPTLYTLEYNPEGSLLLQKATVV